MLVQWWRHLIILPNQHVVTGSKQTKRIGWSHRWYSNFCVWYQWEIYGTSVANLINICDCIVVQKNRNYRRDWDIGSYNFQSFFLLLLLKQFWHNFFKNALGSSYNFNPIEITRRKSMFGLFYISVNGNVTFAYIMTFHSTSVYPIITFLLLIFAPKHLNSMMIAKENSFLAKTKIVLVGK